MICDRLVAGCLVLGFAVVACDSSEPAWKPTDGVGEGQAADAGTTGGFLAACEDDDDCTGGGKCVGIGNDKRCSRVCNETSPCPDLEGWSCGQGICRCTPGVRSKECGVDKDCDGEADQAVSVEVCNGIDDDCNDVIDDVSSGAQGATLYYRDKDGDGFGDVDKTGWFCNKPGGWVDNLGDCDDERAEDNPDAEEICGDSFDNDCDGKLEDTDVCGLTPIDCPAGKSVSDSGCISATLTSCGETAGVSPALDITELIFKQDPKQIKYTVRLVGSPAVAGCSAYTLGFGEPGGKDLDLVYVFRLPKTGCEAAGLPQLEVYDLKQQQSVQSTAEPGVLVVPVPDPGHVSLVIDKSELFARIPSPTYLLRACTVEKAAGDADRTACSTDSCEAKAHQ